MDYGLIKASQRLSELELKVAIDGWSVEVYWFRAMIKERDWFIRRHTHGTFEFHFAAKGDCLLELDGGAFPVPEGSFYITAPDVYHSQLRGASEGFVEYSLNCDLKPLVPEAAGRLDGIARLRSAFLRAPCEPRPDASGAIELFEAALREADSRLPGSGSSWPAPAPSTRARRRRARRTRRAPRAAWRASRASWRTTFGRGSRPPI
jgi:hypothetical protein